MNEKMRWLWRVKNTLNNENEPPTNIVNRGREEKGIFSEGGYVFSFC